MKSEYNGQTISYKRKNTDNSVLPSRKSKRQYAENKNAIQLLGEVFPGIDYEFDKTGSDHDPCFQARTTINGVIYEGLGSSKQRAKLQLANHVIERLGLIDHHSDVTSVKEEFSTPQHNFQTTPSFELKKHSQDFFYGDYTTTLSTSERGADAFFIDQMPGRDRPLYTPPSIRNNLPPIWPSLKSNSSGAQMNKKSYPPTHVIGPMLPPEAAQQGFSQLFTNKPPINIEKARCYPVMVLSELFPEMQINWSEGTGRGDRQFKVEAEVQGKRFFGEGRSKKVAKLNLAKTVLLCMYDIHDFKESEITPKSQKTKTDETNLEKKFPLTQLKELIGEELTYDVVQQETSSEEEKIFHASVVVKGVSYEATGKSRNLAKLRAAKKALEVLRPKPLTMDSDEKGKKIVDTSRHPTMVFYELYRDVVFTESESKGGNGLTEYSMEAEVEGHKYSMKASSKKKAKLRLVLTAFEELRNIPMNEWSSIDLKEVLEDKQLSANPAANHPIVLLLKLNPQTRFEVTEDYSSNASSKYKATAHVGDRQFNGEGANKKTAKTCAARHALQTLYGIDPDTYVEDSTRSEYFVNTEPKHEVPVEICNRVSQAVQEKYTQVFQGEAQCKVIAAFVVAKYSSNLPAEDEIPELDVVSIGTGTKCITGDQISHKGETLNDCHGEIIACRGLRQYLYNQLGDSMHGDATTILELKSNGKFALKSNIFLYLFVNTAPCGDGRVFTLQTQQQGAKNKTAGLLRTKIENGQGTIPVPENSIQTSDGILEGERLRTMSCSDKILKWNVIGVQGALLSFFLEPVYMSGIVVGLHYHYDALYRALYKRACKTDGCPEPYRVNKPLLGTPNNTDSARDTSKATSNSFNWYESQRTVEAVNATTGQTVILTPSRLCKVNFFNRFIQLLRQRKVKITEPKTYHAAKLLSKEYQKAKECFFKALEETTCGKWVGKPYEHDMFGY